MLKDKGKQFVPLLILPWTLFKPSSLHVRDDSKTHVSVSNPGKVYSFYRTLASPFIKLLLSLLEILPTALLLLFFAFSLLVGDPSFPELINLLMNFFCGTGLFSAELLFGKLVPLSDCLMFSTVTCPFEPLSDVFCEAKVSLDSLALWFPLALSGSVSGSNARTLSRSCPLSFTCTTCSYYKWKVEGITEIELKKTLSKRN